MNALFNATYPTALLLGGCAPGPGLGPLFGPDGLSGFILIVMILLLVYFLKVWHDGRIGPVRDRAKAVLRERYARGEIDRNEYLQQLKDVDMG